MSVDEDMLDDCERKFTAAGTLVVAATAVNTAVGDLMRLLETTAADDPGFHAAHAAEDAAESAATAQRALRDIRRIAEARETDLQDQIEQLRADYADGARCDG
jgi:hypothetical protein